LPVIQPGRSVRFAMLPEDKDPDDLIRDEGPEAMREVLDGALPLAQMVWNREISSGSYDTPERRAELEARLRQIVNSIRDESVRRHYGQDIAARLTAYFSGGNEKSTPARNNRGQRQNRNYQQKR